jgi:hypothetical protein
MARLISPFFATLFAATVGAIVAYADPTAERCNDVGELTFENWEEWTLITPKPVISEGHGNSWVKVYVNELAEDTYLSAGAPYPECAKVVKPLYSDAEGTRVDKMTIMVKMATGYDPENSDWWYALSNGPGTFLIEQGRVDNCILCHKEAAETDYLFSKEVLNAAKE